MTITVNEAGRLGAAKRWADNVPVRQNLSGLSNERKAAVVTFIEAQRKAQERERKGNV